jgi:ABC-type transport system substrate-binding protein
MYGPPGLIYETLITRDLNGNFADGLATWWNLNRTDPDHPTFELKLREGVKFHDGTPFNSDAVKKIINYYAQDDSWVQYEFGQYTAARTRPDGLTQASGARTTTTWCST